MCCYRARVCVAGGQEGGSAAGGATEYQYTKDPEEARIEHEKELQRLKEDCEVESPPVETLQEVLKIPTPAAASANNPPASNINLDKTLEVTFV